MKLSAFMITTALGVVALTTTAAHAQSVDPCSVYTCMAGISGSGATGGPACGPAIDMFFSIVIFDPWYDAQATAMARRQFMMTCAGADIATNAAILNAIIAEWGYIL